MSNREPESNRSPRRSRSRHAPRACIRFHIELDIVIDTLLAVWENKV